MITVLCGILAQEWEALMNGNIGWAVACALLLAISLINTIIIWRQPESKKRLTFKVRVKSGKLLIILGLREAGLSAVLGLASFVLSIHGRNDDTFCLSE